MGGSTLFLRSLEQHHAVISSISPGPNKWVSVNVHHGVYNNGNSYNVVKKVEVVSAYEHLKDSGSTSARRQLALEVKISHSFASKIIEEVESGMIVHPASTIVANNREHDSCI